MRWLLCCVWTGVDGLGMHIIPYRQGDEVCSHYSCPGTVLRAKFSVCQWLQHIIDNRSHDENIDTHSPSVISRTASAPMMVFITTTVTHERSLFSRLVHPCLQSDCNMISCETPIPQILSTKPPTSQRGASAN